MMTSKFLPSGQKNLSNLTDLTESLYKYNHCIAVALY